MTDAMLQPAVFFNLRGKIGVHLVHPLVSTGSTPVQKDLSLLEPWAASPLDVESDPGVDARRKVPPYTQGGCFSPTGQREGTQLNKEEQMGKP